MGFSQRLMPIFTEQVSQCPIYIADIGGVLLAFDIIQQFIINNEGETKFAFLHLNKYDTLCPEELSFESFICPSRH